MTQAWKTMVADAIAKPPAKRTPLEIESIREITDEQFHDALGEIRDELPH